MRTALFFSLLVFALGVFANETKLDPAENADHNRYKIAANWSELKTGWNTLTMQITSPDAIPTTEAMVEVVYDMVGMPMKPPQKPVVEKGDGYYEKQVFFGVAGNWKLDMTIMSGEVEDTHSKIEYIEK